jgi:hypothetical protein
MRIWITRLLIATVTAWNLQAACVFILSPVTFVNAYELSGVPGEAAVRGIGVLFLMWNVPYITALWDPVRYKLALFFTVIMQFIGLVGESYILSTLPPEHSMLHTSILRFIVFDGAGLIMLFAAFAIGSSLLDVSTGRKR